MVYRKLLVLNVLLLVLSPNLLALYSYYGEEMVVRGYVSSDGTVEDVVNWPVEVREFVPNPPEVSPFVPPIGRLILRVNCSGLGYFEMRLDPSELLDMGVRRVVVYASPNPRRGIGWKVLPVSSCEYMVNLSASSIPMLPRIESCYTFELVRLYHFAAVVGSRAPCKESDRLAAEMLSRITTIELAEDDEIACDRDMIVVGGPLANRKAVSHNRLANISFIVGRQEIVLIWRGLKYQYTYDKWGEEDYAIIAVAYHDGFIIVYVEGCTRYGTFAAAKYLVENIDALINFEVIIIRWRDSDGSHDVTPEDDIELIEHYP